MGRTLVVTTSRGHTGHGCRMWLVATRTQGARHNGVW